MQTMLGTFSESLMKALAIARGVSCAGDMLRIAH
jgi:hypothetical protein